MVTFPIFLTRINIYFRCIKLSIITFIPNFLIMNFKKNITINGAENKLIAIDVFVPEKANKSPIILYAHGFCGFKDWGNFDLIAKEFVEAGFAFVKFNFSHNGTSPEFPEDFVDLEAFGNNNYSIELEDLKIVTDWIVDANNQYLNHSLQENLYLIGHSMGGGMSILLAAVDTRIRKLVTWASIAACKTPWGNWDSDRLELWKTTGVQYYTNGRTKQDLPLYYQLYLDYIQHEDEYDIPNKLASLTIPVLICQGTKDTAVTLDCALLLHERLPSSKLFTIESDHVFGRSHPCISNVLPDTTLAVVTETIKFLHLK